MEKDIGDGGMTIKRKLQIVTDVAMIVLLPFLMSYQLIGEATHEWFGIGMFLLLVFHHLLNLHWHKNLCKGKYNWLRASVALIDVLLCFIMVSLAVSGVIMSKHIFIFLPIEGGSGWARMIHMIASYWGFALMSIHLGMHWNMILGLINRTIWKNERAVWRTIGSKVAVMVFCCYGVHAFIKRQLGDYMLLKTEFVFFDFGEPLLFFLADYAAVILLFASLGYYFSKLLKTIKKTERR